MSVCWWSPDVGTEDGEREDWFALPPGFLQNLIKPYFFKSKPCFSKPNHTFPNETILFQNETILFQTKQWFFNCFRVVLLLISMVFNGQAPLVEWWNGFNGSLRSMPKCTLTLTLTPTQTKTYVTSTNLTVGADSDVFVIQKLCSNSFGTSQSCKIYFLRSRNVEVPYIFWNNF